jgi:tRNA-specific 2-thiouridylase
MRILAAMSGGVDSSVVAGLLQEDGHEVIGVTLQLYDDAGSVARPGACCAGQDIHDAKRVADHLGIAHYVIDAQARFRAAVIARFADSYAAGQTPVPCVRCNQSVKFHDLLALANDLDAEALATGHYVRRVEGSNGPELHRARDSARDQSWFLFATTRRQLERSRFPLGDMDDKAAVRRQAARLGLSVADKPDSQDICFVPKGNYADQVAKLRPDALESGEIVDETGAAVGRHRGIARYTVGQARRLGLKDGRVVIHLDANQRRIVVGPRDSGRTELWLSEVNWLIDPPTEPLACTVKLRARDSQRPAIVTAGQGEARVHLAEPALPAPGQACVIYQDDRILGGGFIKQQPR